MYSTRLDVVELVFNQVICYDYARSISKIHTLSQYLVLEFKDLVLNYRRDAMYNDTTSINQNWCINLIFLKLNQILCAKSSL